MSLVRALVATLLWLASRTKILHDLGRLGTAEPRMLIDMMAAVAPDEAPDLPGADCAPDVAPAAAGDGAEDRRGQLLDTRLRWAREEDSPVR